ncbi:MAG: DUF2339 domain-containing protein, partial [Bacillota bacterium]|nr:DUF2339 domain-containing protein [Bacillota bacterium]
MGGVLVLIFVGFLWLVVKAASAGSLQQDINLLHSRLASIARDLSELRRENEALRRELVAGGSLPEGWAPPPPAETVGAPQPQPAGAAAAGGPVVVGSEENPAVAFRVRRAIIDLPEAGSYAHQLRASVKAGKVTLEGTVPSTADREIVERAVYGALGVTSVVNLLQTGRHVPAPAMASLQEHVAQPVVAAPAQSALTARPAVPSQPAQLLEPHGAPTSPVLPPAPQPPATPQPSVLPTASKARVAAAARKASPKPRIARPAVDWSRAWAAIAGPLAAARAAPGGRGTTGAPGEADSQVSRAEAAVGVIWLSRVGVILLIVGAIFAYRYGVTNDYLRTALGYVAGLAVLGLGWWGHRRRYRVWSQAMTGGGIAILYLSTTAATVLFDRPIMPYGVGFGLMVLTTVLATGLAVAYDSMVVGLFGLIGGFATPFLLSTGSGGGGFGGLFAYIAVLDAGLLLVAYFRRWPLFNYIVFVTTWGIYWLWRVSRFHTGLAATGMWAATAYHLIFALLSIAHTVMRGKKGSPAELALATLNGFAYFACALDLLVRQPAGVRGAFALGLAGFYVAMGVLNFRLNRKDRLMTMALLGLSWVFGTAAVPVALDGSWITVAWAVEGATLIWLGLRAPVKHVDTAGLAVLGLAVARLVSIDSFPETFGLLLAGPALRAVTFAAVIGSAYAAAWTLTVAARRLNPASHTQGPGGLVVRDVLGAAGCVLTVWYMTREVLLYYPSARQVGSV